MLLTYSLLSPTVVLWSSCRQLIERGRHYKSVFIRQSSGPLSAERGANAGVDSCRGTSHRDSVSRWYSHWPHPVCRTDRVCIRQLDRRWTWLRWR